MIPATDPAIPESVRSVLIVGGTFDPPHRGHIEPPFFAQHRLALDWVLFVPAARSPHKESPAASDEDRCAMLRLALAGRSGWSISRLELERGGASYTVDTLEIIREAVGPEVTLRLFLGADQALRLSTWKDPRRIAELARPLVYPRPPETVGDLRARGIASEWLDVGDEVPLCNFSATAIRTTLESGADVVPGLSPAVLEYIRTQGLYRK